MSVDYEQDYLAPNGVLYCSIECALEDNLEQNWSPYDLMPIGYEEYDQMCDEAGPGNGPGALCPYCDDEYHCY